MSSIRIPFMFESGRVATTVSPTTVAEQKIVDVLVTENYERPMRHTYGAGIRRLVFEPIGDLEISDFSVDAQQDMSENITRVSILDIQISEQESLATYSNLETTLGVNVYYKIPLGSPKVLSFKIESTGLLVADTPI